MLHKSCSMPQMKKNSWLSINGIFLSAPMLPSQNAIRSYRSWFMLFTGSTFLQLGVYISTDLDGLKWITLLTRLQFTPMPSATVDMSTLMWPSSLLIFLTICCFTWVAVPAWYISMTKARSSTFSLCTIFSLATGGCSFIEVAFSRLSLLKIP